MPWGRIIVTLSIALDRPAEIIQPDGTNIQIAYQGNQTTVTDEDNNKKRYAYDAFHDLTAVWEPNASGSLAWETTYAYNPGRELVAATQSGDGSKSVSRAFTYDLDRLIAEQTPEAERKTYTYDPDGNVISVTTGRGTITYSYDALNRVISETGGSIDNSYTYDLATTPGGFSSQNPIGRLVEASNGVNASEQFSYDSMGRIVYQANCIPTDCTQTGNAVLAQYDSIGDLTSFTYPDGRVITQGFDAAQNLTGVQLSSWNGQSQSLSYVTGMTYAPHRTTYRGNLW